MLPPYDLENILNAIADPVFVKDRQHRWVLLNDAFCKFIGHGRASLIGKSDYDFFPQTEADVFWQKDELVFQTGEENDNTEQFTAADGSTHFITTRKMLYTSAAGDKFIVGCIRDLTDLNRAQHDLLNARQQLEEKVLERTLELAAMNQALSRHIADHDRTAEQLRQSQKMEAIGQLAGGVAHDFNNLLNVIIGYGSLIEHWPTADANLNDIAQHIIDAAETAASLTRQLLAFSRKQVLQPEVLELNEVVTTVGNMLRRLIGEHIEIDIRTSPAAGSMRVDRGQFEQVIINLAVNARDAMPNGGRLIIETSTVDLLPQTVNGPTPAPGKRVALTVTDTGKGMLPEVQAHIFEPFFTTKEQGKGTGLGLATVYGIVTQSDGSISVRSTPGKGTTFTLLFPQVEEQSAGPAPRLARILPQPGSETLLLVEDQADLRLLLRRILQTQGYTVLEAASGEEAIALATDRHDIDLLITDIIMPGMRGWELSQKLSVLHPKLKVLYISGHTDTDLISEGALLDGGIFLEKPFKPEVLLSKVREILRPTTAPARSGINGQ
jgi:PAS domain S-box-containing protein